MYSRLLIWSLRHRRGAHVLNAIAIALASATVMVFMAVLIDFTRITRSFTAHNDVRVIVVPKLAPPGSTTGGMPVSLTSSFEGITGVKTVQHMLVFAGSIPGSLPYGISGEDDSGIDLNKDLYPADAAPVDAWKKERLSALVTEPLAKDLHLEVGKLAEVPTTYGPMKIKVVGILLGSIVTRAIAIHFDYAQQFSKNTETCSYRLFVPPDLLDGVVTEIAAQTKNSSVPAQGVESGRFRAGVAKRAATIPAALGFLGLFLVFTTALTLANNRAISIRERRVEVATLRVLGYYPRSILRLLVSEAVLIGLIGGLVAVIAAYLAFHAGLRLTPKGMPPAALDMLSIGAGIAVAIIVPLIGSLPSAVAAVRVPLVDGLRESA